MQVDTRPDTIANIASYYGVNSDKLQRHYKHQVSGYHDWSQKVHADQYILYPDNISEEISIDEVSLSKGELYTVVTNKRLKSKNKKSVIAIINGTEAHKIQSVLNQIPENKRLAVKYVSMDMARNMALASQNSFENSVKVIDRFHVIRLVMDALQHIRIKFRWKEIDLENMAIKQAKAMGQKYKPLLLANGDTMKELLVRSKYLLYKYESQWTYNQSQRAKILFDKFPLLKKVYDLSIEFRNLYKKYSKSQGLAGFLDWKNKARALSIDELNSVIHTLEYNLPAILNFFINRSTNAYAESFNSKIKAFRANLRGVKDVKFFLYRLEKLFA